MYGLRDPCLQGEDGWGDQVVASQLQALFKLLWELIKLVL